MQYCPSFLFKNSKFPPIATELNTLNPAVFACIGCQEYIHNAHCPWDAAIINQIGPFPVSCNSETPQKRMYSLILIEFIQIHHVTDERLHILQLIPGAAIYEGVHPSPFAIAKWRSKSCGFCSKCLFQISWVSSPHDCLAALTHREENILPASWSQSCDEAVRSECFSHLRCSVEILPANGFMDTTDWMRKPSVISGGHTNIRRRESVQISQFNHLR